MKKLAGIFLIFSILLIALSACSGSSASAPERAGKWTATSDAGDIEFLIDNTGSLITSITVTYDCKGKPISYRGTATLTTKEDGWPIKNGKFNIKDFKDSKLKFLINGTFSNQNTDLNGTLSIYGCTADYSMIAKP